MMVKNLGWMACLILLAETVGNPLESYASSFNFTSGSTTGNGYGNSVIRTIDGIIITGTSWSLTGGASNKLFEAGQIRIWSTGIGICSQNEGSNCTNPEHSLDAVNLFDFLLFTFNQRIQLDSADLTARLFDFNSTLWAGTGTPDLNGKTLSSASLGTGIESLYTSNNAMAGQTTRTINLSIIFTQPVDWFFIGASVNYPSPADSFKFKTLTVNSPPPPHPRFLNPQRHYSWELSSSVFWQSENGINPNATPYDFYFLLLLSNPLLTFPMPHRQSHKFSSIQPPHLF